ncbi:MAG: V-type ATP synthase subunit D [Phycisphaerae bacterium]
MAKKVRLTRPELKRQRDALARFERYLPMLKLKQQQLQLTIREVNANQSRARAAAEAARGVFEPYRAVLADVAGLNVPKLAECEQVRTGQVNVAGVNIPVFEEAVFPKAVYSLFATPPWVDRALADLRTLNRRLAEVEVIEEQYRLLHRELTKIIQRVNLFDKVKIPEARENIRVIRIRLGDQMTAAVGRAKIAKAKISETSQRFDDLRQSPEEPREAETP